MRDYQIANFLSENEVIYLDLINNVDKLFSNREYHFIDIFNRLKNEYNIIKKEKSSKNTPSKTLLPSHQFFIKKEISIEKFINYTIHTLNLLDDIEYEFENNIDFHIKTVIDGFYMIFDMRIVNIENWYAIQITGNMKNNYEIHSFLTKIYQQDYLENILETTIKTENQSFLSDDEEGFIEEINEAIHILRSDNNQEIENTLQMIYNLMTSSFIIQNRLMYRISKRLVENIISLKYKLHKYTQFSIILHNIVKIYPSYSQQIYPILFEMMEGNVIQQRYALKTLLYCDLVLCIEINKQFVSEMLMRENNDIKVIYYLLDLL